MPGAMFLGLVTHPSTRFRESSTPDGLLPTLTALLSDRGMTTTLAIHGTNDYDAGFLAIDRAQIAASIDAELDVESRWRTYVDPSVPRWSLGPFMQVRRLYRRRKFLPSGRRAVRMDDAGARMVQRLVNIELAHLSLMRQAVACGSDWALIAEDDATCSDVAQLAEALDVFSEAQSMASQPKYVNVSRSFDHGRLRVGSLLSDRGAWGTAGDGVRVLTSERPITNTVCAVLYRTTFLEKLLAVMDSIPLSPVVPIDWKLNEAIMRMSAAGELGPGDCWVVEPAPMIQSSMVLETSRG